MEGPYGLALSAGLLAAVNPCGFALLPTYLTMLVLGEDPARHNARLAPVGRALALTTAMTTGFVAVFGSFGLLAAPVAGAIVSRLPWLSIVIGLALLAAGGWLLAGRQLPVLTPKVTTGPAFRRRFVSMAGFGAAYAVTSLGCTIGPFLAVVGAGFRADSVPAGIGLFVAYAVGMGLVVGAAALAVALARESLLRRTRRAAPLLTRIGGALLVLTGGYVAWYGWYEIRVYGGADASDPVVEWAAAQQATLSGWFAELGPGFFAAVAGVLLTTGVAVTLARRGD